MYKNIRRELGVSGFIVSGGGSLAAHLDEFYEARVVDISKGLLLWRSFYQTRGSVAM